MAIQIPEKLQSSKGDGTLSRSIKGAVGVLVFLGASYTPLTQEGLTELVNQLLVVLTALYTFYGLAMKAYNKWTGDVQ